MFLKKKISFFLVLLVCFNFYAQQDSIAVKKVTSVKKISKYNGVYNPLKPSKAAFYSAIFPGMGQIYNKKYWLTPIIWGGMATSLYYYDLNNDDYKRYRTAFKLREAGLVDEFTVDGVELLSRESLISAQKTLRKNRDLSLLTTAIIYILQIVEASINAHLLQFNTSDNLSFEPLLVPAPIEFEAPKFGFTLKYTF